MKWESFHHPDISLPVIRRKISDELIVLLSETAETLLTRGANVVYKSFYPNDRARHAAIKRLKDKGLVAHVNPRDNLPRLRLTPAAETKIPLYYHPEKQWKKRWNKWWYILMFDVPEADRSYRDTLRFFLKKQKFGCLQKSVWVTPRDVRPEYDDLNRAAAVDTIAFLFEARTVLGFGNQSVVQDAWDFEKIHLVQSHYIAVAEENIFRLKDGCPPEAALQLLRIDSLAYAQAMSIDPLLPTELHSESYTGPEALAAHRRLIQAVLSALN